MSTLTSFRPDGAGPLAHAVITASSAPLLLLDGDLTVVAASRSFYRAFDLANDARDRIVFEMGDGEWDAPTLRTLLRAALAGDVDAEPCEMDLLRPGEDDRRLVLSAQKLDPSDEGEVRLLLSIIDVTAARLSERIKDNLLREKDILLREIQHRVANSLQIICSILLQSARTVQSLESRTHLQDAHERVMSIAAVQNQLAVSQLSEIRLRPYLIELCKSLAASMISDPEQITLEVASEDVALDPDKSVSLGLIVTELVINALKHAFPDRRKGKIKVGYETEGAGWSLIVRDNGVGMAREHPVAAAGLGTSIVEALARQLQARILVEDGDPGALIRVVHRTVAAFASGGNNLPDVRPI